MISVVVCTYNRAHYLKDTLVHLQNQDAPLDLFEVLVIDNNSNDHTRQVCETFYEQYKDFPFRYVMETQQGLSHARNRGITEARSDVVTFIDDDAFTTPSFISAITTYMSSHQDVIALGGKIIPRYENNEPKWMSNYLLPLVAALDLGDSVKPFPTNKFPIGANMSIRKGAFVEFGDFNVSLGRKGNSLEGSEEKDLFYRIKKAGHSIIYLPEAVVHHIIPAKRVSLEYIKNQAIGIGKSERLRTQHLGQFQKFLFGELVKWGGSLILSLMYILTFRPAKGIMLIRFRLFVTKGILIKD